MPLSFLGMRKPIVFGIIWMIICVVPPLYFAHEEKAQTKLQLANKELLEINRKLLEDSKERTKSNKPIFLHNEKMLEIALQDLNKIKKKLEIE